MTVFTFSPNIPDAAHNPSFDQPNMKVNNQSTNGILAVDHVTFNIANPSNTAPSPGQSGGQHLQVTFNSKNAPLGAPTDPLSILYTNSGGASPVADMYFRNANSFFPISIMRAWGIIDGATGVQDAQQSTNFTSTGGAGVYNVVCNANVINSNNFGVLISLNTTLNLNARFTITGTGTFTINTVSAPTKIIIAVFQI
jgi:hypothetical protein